MAVSAWTRKAWWSLLLFPVSFAAAFVAGEGIATAAGYSQPSLDSTPGWVIVLAALAALAVFALPLLVIRRFARRAAEAGDLSGRAPLVVGLAVVAVFVAMNLLGLGAQLVAG